MWASAPTGAPRTRDGGQVSCGRSLPRLSRGPSHGAPQRKPSGIPFRPCLTTRVRAVSTGFPPADAGLDPAAPATFALGRMTPGRVGDQEPQWVPRSSGNVRSNACLHPAKRMSVKMQGIMGAGPHLLGCGTGAITWLRRDGAQAVLAVRCADRVCSPSAGPDLRDSRRQPWPPRFFLNSV